MLDGYWLFLGSAFLCMLPNTYFAQKILPDEKSTVMVSCDCVIILL
jgi:hypothetical protein